MLLDHLARLVSFDTRNPPRAADGLHGLMSYVSQVVEASGFVVEMRDLGDGCTWLHAVRGPPTASGPHAPAPREPSSPWSAALSSSAAPSQAAPQPAAPSSAFGAPPLVNVHVDTVPLAEGWTRDPFALHVEGGRAVGLGACDIKGALAAWLSAASSTTGAAALLLTSDEEAGTSRCVRTFAAEHQLQGRRVVVAEPTRCRAVLAHRGIGTASGTFTGVPGHASQARALVDSAVHEAVRWCAAALDHAVRAGGTGAGADGGDTRDIRFNLGRIEGGTKANMIASSASVRFGVRPLRDVAGVVDAVCALAPDPARVTWERGYLAPALVESERSRALARELGVEVGGAVDFFTEAALFAEAGAIAMVVGPGNIEQAHTADEFVDVSQLELAERFYARLLGERGVNVGTGR